MLDTIYTILIAAGIVLPLLSLLFGGVDALLPAGPLRDLLVDGIIGGVGAVIWIWTATETPGSSLLISTPCFSPWWWWAASANCA